MNKISFTIGEVEIGLEAPLFLMAGPCVIESEACCLDIANRLVDISENPKLAYFVAGNSLKPICVSGLHGSTEIQEKSSIEIILSNFEDPVPDAGLRVIIRNIDNEIIMKREFPDITIKGNVSVTSACTMDLKGITEGLYSIEYFLLDNNEKELAKKPENDVDTLKLRLELTQAKINQIQLAIRQKYKQEILNNEETETIGSMISDNIFNDTRYITEELKVNMQKEVELLNKDLSNDEKGIIEKRIIEDVNKIDKRHKLKITTFFICNVLLPQKSKKNLILLK